MMESGTLGKETQYQTHETRSFLECGFDSNAVKVGMRVVAVLKDKSKRTGGLTDIEYFKPE